MIDIVRCDGKVGKNKDFDPLKIRRTEELWRDEKPEDDRKGSDSSTGRSAKAVRRGVFDKVQCESKKDAEEEDRID